MKFPEEKPRLLPPLSSPLLSLSHLLSVLPLSGESADVGPAQLLHNLHHRLCLQISATLSTNIHAKFETISD